MVFAWKSSKYVEDFSTRLEFAAKTAEMKAAILEVWNVEA
jgi:hypothetical protein